MTASEIDLGAPDVWRSGFPHELFTQLRRQTPVFRHELTPGVAEQVDREFWVCTKHRHARRIHREFNSFTATQGPLIQVLPNFDVVPSVITLDPPEQTLRRRLISSAFTPKAIAKLEEGIRSRAAVMVGGLVEHGGGDWIHEVAGLLPMTVIGDIVGIPESDRPEIFRLIDQSLQTKNPDSGISPDEELGFLTKIFEYATALTAEKRANPTDDIWSTLCSAMITEDDGTQFRLPAMELEMFFYVLTLAGADTTKNALAGGLQAFVENPAQIQIYREREDARSLAVEEVLRWTTPVTFWVRSTTVDVEMDGETIPPGSRVVAVLASANRDEEVFADPFRFDITRVDNPHVTFGGGGPHHCLGNMLARAEIRAVFDELFARDAAIALEPAQVAYPSLKTNMYLYESLRAHVTVG